MEDEVSRGWGISLVGWPAAKPVVKPVQPPLRGPCIHRLLAGRACAGVCHAVVSTQTSFLTGSCGDFAVFRVSVRWQVSIWHL